MPDIFVGEVAVGVVPDARGWDERVRKQLVPSSGQIGRDMGQSITRGIVSNLNVGRAVSDSASRSSGDSARGGDQAAGAFADAFKKKLQAALKSLPKAKIDADATDADRRIAEIRAQLEELSTKTIGVDISDADAIAKLHFLDYELQALRHNADIPLRFNVDRARSQLVGLRRELQATADSADSSWGRFRNTLAGIAGRGGGGGGLSSMGLFGKIWFAAGLATSVAEPAIASVTVAVMGLVGGLTAVALGMGAFGLVAKSVLTQSATAAQAAQQAQATYTKAIDVAHLHYTSAMDSATTKAQRQAAAQTLQTATASAYAQKVAGIQAAYQNLSPAQVRLAKEMAAVKKEWQDFVKQNAPGVARVLEQGMGLLPKVLKAIEPFLKPVEIGLHAILSSLGTDLSSTGFANWIHSMANESGPALIRIWVAIRDIFIGLGGVIRAFLPFANQELDNVDKMATAFAHWGSTMGPTHSGFRGLLATAKADGPLAVQVLKNLAVVVKNVVAAMTGLTGVGNSRQFLVLLLNLSGVLRTLSDNPWLARIILYTLTLRSAFTRISPAIGAASKFLKGFSDTAKAASAETGVAGSLGGGLKNLVTGFRDSEAAGSAATGVMGTFGGYVKTAGLAVVTFVTGIKTWVIWSKIAQLATKVWTGIQIAFNAVMDANPIALVIIGIAALVAAVIYAWTHFRTFRVIVEGVWNAIKSATADVVNFIRQHWKLLVTILVGVLTSGLGAVVILVISHWHTIEHWFQDGINFVKGIVRDGLHIVLSIWNNFWDSNVAVVRAGRNLILGIFDIMWGAIKSGFRDVVDVVGRVWGGIKSIFSAPVKFLVNTVYDNGIARLWNDVMGAIHGPKLPILHFATGGRVPGWGGGDIQPALVEPGETVVSKEHSRVLAPVFRAAGVPGYQGGGIIGGIGHFLGNIFGGAWDVAKIVTALLTGNAKAAENAFADLIHTPAVGILGRMMVGIPQTIIEQGVKYLITWLRTSLGSGGAAGGGIPGNVWSYAPEMRTVMLMLRQPVQDFIIGLRQMQTESGGNPLVVNKSDINWQEGHPSVGLMQVIAGTFDAFAGPYRSVGPFEYGVSVNPMANIYSGLHYAVENYGSAPGGWTNVLGHGHGYDKGGWWLPGTLGWNMSGEPEPVLTGHQWAVFDALSTHVANYMDESSRNPSGATEYHAHFDGMTAQVLQGQVRQAFAVMEMQHGTLSRAGRRS